MNEHIVEVFREAIVMDNYDILKDRLSLKERGALLDSISKYDGNDPLMNMLNDMLSKLDEEALSRFQGKFDDVIFNFYTEAEAIELSKNIASFDEANQVAIISSLPTDDMKLACLEKVEPIRYGPEIISKFEDDGKKIEYLNRLVGEDNEVRRYNIISSLGKDKDELKLQNLDKLNEDHRYKIVSSLTKENLKLQGLDKLTDDEHRYQIVFRLDDDRLKIQGLDRLTEEDHIYKILSSLGEDKEEVKIQNLNRLTKENHIYKILSSLGKDKDEVKIQNLNRLTEEFHIYRILSSLGKDKDEVKIQNLNRLTEEEHIYEILSSLNSDELKIQGLDKLQYEDNIYRVLYSLGKDKDELRLQNLYRLTDEQYISIVVSQLSEKADDIKLQYLKNMKSEHSIYPILSSLGKDKDEVKIQYLNRLTNERYIYEILSSLGKDKDEVKIQNLDKLSREDFIYDILSSLGEDKEEVKIQNLHRLHNDMNVCNVVLEMKPENVTKNIFQILDNIEENGYKLHIIGKFIQDDILINECLDKINLFKNDPHEMGLEKKRKMLAEFKKNYSLTMLKSFTDYISSHEEQITLDNIDKLIKVLRGFEYSNSLELTSFKETLMPQVLDSPDPLKALEKLERIFLRNNIPMFGKVFLCFQTLYPEFNKSDFDFNSEKMSPELRNPVQTTQMKTVNRNASLKDMRFQMIFNDLLRIAMRSNNRSLREYISNIEKGNTLFLGLSNGIIKYNELDDESKKILDVFSEHLGALYERMQHGSETVLKGLSKEEKIMYFSQKFKTTKKYDLPDRIIRSFAYQAGFENFEQFKEAMTNSVREKEAISRKRSEELSSGKKLVLKPGDFLRGIGDINGFGSSLDNGNVCNEFLGTFKGTSKSDGTPLDIDWSLVTEENLSILQNVETSITKEDYGDIYFIIKGDNPNIKITRDNQGNLIDTPYEPDKMEMFRTLKYSQFGTRTGVASSDVDYILLNESKLNVHDISIVKNEIVKNGFYIPVVDMEGNLIFSAKEYDELKEKMMGLSYYGSNEYHLKEHRDSQYVDDIKTFLPSNERITKAQSNMVYQAISKAIGEIVIDENGTKMVARNEIGNNIVNGSIEVLETGSSARGTNVPYDYDFDYIFRLDAEWLKEPEKNKYLREQICKSLNISPVPTDDFRDVVAEIPGMGKVKLDITFIKKNDKVEYSTEMALKDRLDTMEKIDSNMKNEVAANVILAKMLFKKNGCYKPYRRDASQGGLGGVGVENWIVQNGGTLESAAKSFLEASEGKSFEEFIKTYQIHDYGKNHMYEVKGYYPYDEFVYCNMANKDIKNGDVGYRKMQEVLKRYLRYLDGDKEALPEIDALIEELKNERDSEYLLEEDSVHRSRGHVTFSIIMIISFMMSILTIISCLLLK